MPVGMINSCLPAAAATSNDFYHRYDFLSDRAPATVKHQWADQRGTGLQDDPAIHYGSSLNAIFQPGDNAIQNR